jgi:hypothetical protein
VPLLNFLLLGFFLLIYCAPSRSYHMHREYQKVHHIFTAGFVATRTRKIYSLHSFPWEALGFGNTLVKNYSSKMWLLFIIQITITSKCF